MEAKGLLVGGVLPAVMFGLAGLMQKMTTRTGVGLGPYLLCIGVGVLVMGAVLTMGATGPARAITGKGALMSGALGIFWALGTWFVAVGLSHYAAPLAKLVPLYNMNTLIVVVLALIVFAEFRDVAVTKLVAGAALIVVGGTLVANA
ncbi:hypothetical protein GF314_04360 [bacterium]|nr:hypothetical protein [bacterium]